MGIDPDPLLRVLGKNRVVLKARVDLETKILARSIPRTRASYPVFEQPRLGLEKVDGFPRVAEELQFAFPQAQAQRPSVESYRQSMLAHLPAETQGFEGKTVLPFSRQRVDHEKGLAVVGDLPKQVGLAPGCIPIDIDPERG